MVLLSILGGAWSWLPAACISGLHRPLLMTVHFPDCALSRRGGPGGADRGVHAGEKGGGVGGQHRSRGGFVVHFTARPPSQSTVLGVVRGQLQEQAGVSEGAVRRAEQQ